MSAISYQKSMQMNEVDIMFEAEMPLQLEERDDHDEDTVSELAQSEVYSQSSVATRESSVKFAPLPQPSRTSPENMPSLPRQLPSRSSRHSESPPRQLPTRTSVDSLSPPRQLPNQRSLNSQSPPRQLPSRTSEDSLSPPRQLPNQRSLNSQSLPRQLPSRTSHDSPSPPRQMSSSVSRPHPNITPTTTTTPVGKYNSNSSTSPSLLPPPALLSPRRTPLGSDAFELGFEEKISSKVQPSDKTWLSSAEKKAKESRRPITITASQVESPPRRYLEERVASEMVVFLTFFIHL
jgi:hypothetical protein